MPETMPQELELRLGAIFAPISAWPRYARRFNGTAEQLVAEADISRYSSQPLTIGA